MVISKLIIEIEGRGKEMRVKFIFYYLLLFLVLLKFWYILVGILLKINYEN